MINGIMTGLFCFLLLTHTNKIYASPEEPTKEATKPIAQGQSLANTAAIIIPLILIIILLIVIIAVIVIIVLVYRARKYVVLWQL